MNVVTNDNTDPAGRRRLCQAWDVAIQPLGDVSEDDEELCAILSYAKPGTLDLPMFTERLLPGKESFIVCPVAIKPTLMSSRHHMELEESSNGKHRHRYPTVINNRSMCNADRSNLPPKKRHIDFSLEEKLPLKKRPLKKEHVDRIVEERIPLKKRRVTGNPVFTQESAYAEHRTNKAMNISIQPTPSTSMIPDSFLRKRTLEDDYPHDMEDRCLKNVKRSKSVDNCGTFFGHVIHSSVSFHFV